MPLYGKINPRLSWNKNPETDVTGYVIFWGLVSGVYTEQVDVGLTTDPNSPAVIMTGFTFIQRWHYFAVKAYDAAGNFSPYSAEVAYYVSDPYTREVFSKVLARRG